MIKVELPVLEKLFSPIQERTWHPNVIFNPFPMVVTLL